MAEVVKPEIKHHNGLLASLSLCTAGPHGEDGQGGDGVWVTKSVRPCHFPGLVMGAGRVTRSKTSDEGQTLILSRALGTGREAATPQGAGLLKAMMSQ